MSMRIPEISVGANTLEKVSAACLAGADSIYAGFEGFSLEADVPCFETEKIGGIISFCSEHSVKVYLSIDRFFQNREIDLLDFKLKEISKYRFDAFIVSDIGILQTIRKHFPSAVFHLSSFANCVNSLSVAEYEKLGFDSFIPGHESSLQEIARMAASCSNLKTEIPVHGVMCISYSGRTLISSHLGPGPRLNEGSLALEEEERRGLYCPVVQKEGYMLVFSSKELCMAGYMKQIIDSQVSSIRIQTGKNSAEYISNAVSLYKKELNCLSESLNYTISQKPDSRHFCTGFYFKNGPVDVI